MINGKIEKTCADDVCNNNGPLKVYKKHSTKMLETLDTSGSKNIKT